MSPWNPPLYPMKILMTVGLLLILLQGTARLIRNLYLLRGKKLS
jgi:TRAP-type mannitol/chloroaromatic compound transport system permease small subunit